MQKNIAAVVNEFSKTLSSLGTEFENTLKRLQPDKDEIQIAKPEYVKDDSIQIPTVYKFEQKGNRYYFTEDKTISDYKERIKFFPSVTTIIQKTVPPSWGLENLKMELGKEFNRFFKERSHFGTLDHIFITEYLRSSKEADKRVFDTDTIPTRVQLYAEEHEAEFNKYRIDASSWDWELHRDIRAFVRFIHDYKVDPIAIEVVGTYEDGIYRFAGAIDLLCKMTIREKGLWGEVYKSGENKGQPKESYREREVTAIVDFKSGRNGFYQSHELQLHMYKLLAEQSLGIEVEKLYNVAPSDWRTAPDYKIADQTDSIEAKRIPHILGSYYVEYEAPKDMLVMSGKINGAGSLEESCKWLPACEYVGNKLKGAKWQYQA